MRQDILEVVTFLFRNYLQSNGKLPDNQDALVTALKLAGFHPELIYKSFDWLSGLIQQQENFINEPGKDSVHIYTPEESVQLDIDCRNLLSFLEQEQILSAKNREIVISQLMRLPHFPITVHDVKWVALIVLFGQPEQREALVKLEQLILD
jgi:Smg protein